MMLQFRSGREGRELLSLGFAMDRIALGDRDFNVDLESGMTFDNIENEATFYVNLMNPSEAEDSNFLAPERGGGGKTLGNVEKKEAAKEKRKKMSCKKPLRPSQGPSLDAAYQKLIREITELAMLKRERMERMRALKKTKNSKESSSLNNTVIALVFKVIFFSVVIFQGISPKTEPPLASLEVLSPESAG